MKFFSTKLDGVSCSKEDIAWRYGAGNVFYPDSLLEEKDNAEANMTVLLGCHMPKMSRSVLLASQYGCGIKVVDEAFLSGAEGDPIVFKGDGLFTEIPKVALLNKSGDAHAIVFESPSASAILVGSWRCIKEGIFGKMVWEFLSRGIDPKDIKINIGPGLGADSYSVAEDVYCSLLAMPGIDNADDRVFQKKAFKAGKPQKYVLNFPELIKQAASAHGIISVDGSTSNNTFDKSEWKSVKSSADPDVLKAYYASRPYFSARLFTRVVRQINRVCEAIGRPLPAGVEPLTATNYGGTGRCLNGVSLAESDAGLPSSSLGTTR